MNLTAPIKNISEQWISEALDTVRALAVAGSPFSGNDVWTKGLTDPGNRRALGVLIVRAHRAGLLTRVGNDTSVGGHGQRISRWVGTGDWTAEVTA